MRAHLPGTLPAASDAFIKHTEKGGHLMRLVQKSGITVMLFVVAVVLVQAVVHAQDLIPLWCQEYSGDCMIFSGHYHCCPGYDFGDCYAADDFQVTTEYPINYIRWWAYQLSGSDIIDYFFVTFYSHTGCGAPGGVVAEYEIYDFTRSTVAMGVGQFEASIPPLALVQGQSYWISIRAVLTQPGTYEWRSGRAPDGPWNCNCMAKGDYWNEPDWIPVYPDLWPNPECLAMSFCLYYDESATAVDQSTWGRIKGMLR